jgi:hypothetical protein
MNVQEIISLAMTVSDEDIPLSEGIGFANGAIAKINIECKANLPFFNASTPSEQYQGFPETWQHALLVPFIVGRIKQKDSSQFEYSDAYGEFNMNLVEFRSSYVLPEEYKDASSKTSFEPDYTGHIWGWN